MPSAMFQLVLKVDASKLPDDDEMGGVDRYTVQAPHPAILFAEEGLRLCFVRARNHWVVLRAGEDLPADVDWASTLHHHDTYALVFNMNGKPWRPVGAWETKLFNHDTIGLIFGSDWANKVTNSGRVELERYPQFARMRNVGSDTWLAAHYASEEEESFLTDIIPGESRPGIQRPYEDGDDVVEFWLPNATKKFWTNFVNSVELV